MDREENTKIVISDNCCVCDVCQCPLELTYELETDGWYDMKYCPKCDEIKT